MGKATKNGAKTNAREKIYKNAIFLNDKKKEKNTMGKRQKNALINAIFIEDVVRPDYSHRHPYIHY